MRDSDVNRRIGLRKAGIPAVGGGLPARRGAVRAMSRRLGIAVCTWLFLAAGAGAREPPAEHWPVCRAGDPGQVRLDVSISGMRSAKGSLVVTVYPDRPRRFLDGKYKLGKQVLPVTLPLTRACFAVPKPGWYAVAMFHDENNNGHFDTNIFGYPVEGYGFSNNPKLYLGPPSLAQVRFPAHAGDNAVAVRITY